MKKKIKTKLWHDKHIAKKQKRKKKKHRAKHKIVPKHKHNKPSPKKRIVKIEPPIKFSFIHNTEACCQFFTEIRDIDSSHFKQNRFFDTSLAKVIHIDYAAISTFMAIIDDLRVKKIGLRTILPKDKKCKEFIVKSGLLEHLLDSDGKQFNLLQKNKLVFFEKGIKRLIDADKRKIGELIKQSIKYLINEERHFPPLTSVLAEIKGNSLEHAKDTHWLLGINHEENKVVFNVVDIGEGILKTLHKKWNTIIADWLSNNDLEILQGAFNKQYGSNTRDINRNKGLPVVKDNYTKKNILSLIVITNNVILNFENSSLSKVLNSRRFKGTFYQFEINKACIKNPNSI